MMKISNLWGDPTDVLSTTEPLAAFYHCVVMFRTCMYSATQFQEMTDQLCADDNSNA